ncbi:hypothetical protein ACFW04_013648 [Cataglyphis niger]
MDQNVEPWIYSLFYPYDSYVKIEKDKINYYRDHQKELCTETYQDLRDYMQTMANNLNGPSDRLDICARVFNIKKDYLIDLIVKQKFFGEIAAFVYIIEFQKRGLPHVHILITLKYNFKITTSQIVNKYISAEILDPFDNRNAVPYCPILSIIFNCHINKVVSSIKLVKYLYKYIYKGHNVVIITIESITQNVIINHDEIHNYIKTRYVGPVEANKSHTIMHLPVHLPNEQDVIENEGIKEAMTSALNQVTIQYLYIEIPCYYMFRKEKINVIIIVGQMCSASPTQTELFYLRLLLLTVKGAKSFNHLKTVNGKVCQSFSAACLALGMIEDDDKWRRAMNEAV